MQHKKPYLNRKEYDWLFGDELLSSIPRKAYRTRSFTESVSSRSCWCLIKRFWRSGTLGGRPAPGFVAAVSNSWYFRIVWRMQRREICNRREISCGFVSYILMCQTDIWFRQKDLLWKYNANFSANGIEESIILIYYLDVAGICKCYLASSTNILDMVLVKKTSIHFYLHL